MKKALITGIFGQDGSYLAEILNKSSYEIHGIEKEPLTENADLLKKHIESKGVNAFLHSIDLNSYDSVKHLINDLKPEEIYHLNDGLNRVCGRPCRN